MANKTLLLLLQKGKQLQQNKHIPAVMRKARQ